MSDSNYYRLDIVHMAVPVLINNFVSVYLHVYKCTSTMSDSNYYRLDNVPLAVLVLINNFVSIFTFCPSYTG